jgi:AraC family transcriptional regulator, regulatory protein of adaptative response / methylated-DNA-[protein]-cysteine methyltransferase
VHGFRACRRCHPDVAKTKLSAEASELIRRVCGLIEGNAEGLPSAAALGKEIGMPAARLRRMFRRITGISMRAYADAIRVRRLKQQLRKGNDVTTALYDAGYGSSSRLYENSDRQLGMTPATYRRGGKGMEIGYTIAKTALGHLLLAGTARGISAIYFGDSEVPLIAALNREYPLAEIKRQPAALSHWVQSVVRHLAGRSSQLDLPVDVQATAFQRRVWDELQRIPYGATRSYSEVARSIGQPTATRAVARACATNPVCVLIPCHRVVRENGGLAGYRWGIGRKRELIEAEKRNVERTNGRPGNLRRGRAVD